MVYTGVIDSQHRVAIKSWCAAATPCTGCDPSLYDRVVEMRERRLDEEEAAAEVNKALEGIKKEKELLTKKAKLIDQSLAAINQVGGSAGSDGSAVVMRMLFMYLLMGQFWLNARPLQLL